MVTDCVARVTVTGELDLLTAPLLEQALVAPLRTARTDLVVDLAGVTLLTSNGIRALADARDVAERRGGRLTVVGVDGNKMVSRVFSLLRLDEALRIEDGPSDATKPGSRP